MALLLLIVALWIAAGFGRTVLQRVAVLDESPLERFVYSSALGFGTAAYGIQLIGLLGFIKFWPVTILWLVLAAIGFPGIRANTADAIAFLRALRTRRLSVFGTAWWVSVPCIAVLVLFGVTALLACYMPPSGREWDALSYHLAHPKVFVATGRIGSLPTEHHSNFPYTMEMLYTVGLLYQGFALATMFHFLMGVLTVLAMLAFCRRVLSPSVGFLASVIFVSTPFVLWEARVAYVELGQALYATLAAFAVIHALTVGGDAADKERHQRQWLVLAGTAMGFALGIKYLALIPFGLLGALLLVQRVPLRRVAIYAGLAMLVGSPWYVKNIVVMRNPVYPYVYSVFPHSRYWSRDRADEYQTEQQSFGVPHSLKQPAALSNLAQAPWSLLTGAAQYDNRGNFTFMGQLGGLYAGFILALAFMPGLPRPVRLLLVVGGAQFAAWFFVAQIGRYLVSFLPLLAIPAGYAAVRLGKTRSPAWIARVVAGGVIAGQVVLVFWAVCMLPAGPRGLPDTLREMLGPDVRPMLTSVSLPEIIERLTGAEPVQEKLRAGLDIYSAIEFLNSDTPKDAGVVLYDETKTFYLQRPYLWGNREHSSYIPYDSMPDGHALTDWFRKRGFRYALLNLNWAPDRMATPPAGEEPLNPNGNEPEALRRWVTERTRPTNPWRTLLGAAIREDGWQPVFARNGVIVLEIGGGA